MTRRHYSAQGTRFVHEVHPGYRHASRNNGRWHKPTLWERIGDILRWGREDGQPARYGIVLLIALFALAALWIVALSPASPPASPEANATTSVDGDGAGEGRAQ